MLFYIYTNETSTQEGEKGEGLYMLNEEICKVREMLNESIITGKDYKEIYNLSVELDELIAKYYFGNKNINVIDRKN